MSRFGHLEFDGESLGEVEESRPVKDGAYYFSLASRAYEEADFERAMRYYAKVLEFNPGDAGAWNGQVRAMIELDELREAGQWADKALERFPTEPEVLAAKAVVLGRSGEPQSAMAYSDASMSERGATPYVWLARADVLMARQDKLAEHCLNQALALAPGDWLVAWMASRIQSYYGQFALALKTAQIALSNGAGECVVWLQIGLCQKKLRLIGPALHSLQQARQLNPKNQEARETLRALQQTGWWSRFCGRLRQPFA